MNLIQAINAVGIDGVVYSKKGFRTTGGRFFEEATNHSPGKVSARYLIWIIGTLDQYSLLSDDWDVEPE